jgi:hypothetical protein
MENTATKQHIKISEGANLRGLASAVINNAVRSFLFGTPSEQVMALEFLSSPDLLWWAEAAEAEIKVRRLLENPQQAREALIRKPKKGKSL